MKNDVTLIALDAFDLNSNPDLIQRGRGVLEIDQRARVSEMVC